MGQPPTPDKINQEVNFVKGVFYEVSIIRCHFHHHFCFGEAVDQKTIQEVSQTATMERKNIMKTVHMDYGCTATITDKNDGSARLVIKNQMGKKIKTSTHKNRTAAYSAWRRFCN